MADEPQAIRGIDWKATFPFTLIFRSFRVAVHPSKMALALAALLLIWGGGKLLDGIWPANHRAIANEPNVYEAMRTDPTVNQSFADARALQRNLIRAEYEEKLRELKAQNKPADDLDDIEDAVTTERDRITKAALDEYDKAKKDTTDERLAAVRTRDDKVLAAYDSAAREMERYDRIEGKGLFSSFAGYQIGKLNQVVHHARYGRFVGGGGAFDSLLNFFVIGPSWAFRYHYVYFTIFTIYFLVVMAIFGGAISRIAAVQVARDEKISFRQALSFSASKFLSFVSAPIIPTLIIVVIGLVIALGALVFNIPFLGPIVGGALFVLALAAGFIVTLVLIGLIGGFNLMYPTIAVEGSDSFDAISRSFSYLYARPWRLAFYTIVAAVYGAITYVFVRYFIKLLLSVTHYFAGLGVFRDADNTRPLWHVLWPNPLTAPKLSYQVDWLALGPGETIGAGLLWIWVSLTIAMLGAFAISFYFSASTIIYVLMRHEVDATELDDVYLEQTDDDFGDTSPAPAAVEQAPPSSSSEPAPRSEP